MSDALDVLLRGRPVGALRTDGSGSLEFEYRPDARDRIDAISLSLPVRTEAYEDDACRGTLDWLLPERQVRANIAQRIQADTSDTFALLAHYGRECAGAVQFVERGRREPEPSISWLAPAEFTRRLDDLSTNPFLSLDEDDVELSLGGVQEKALVVVDGDRIGLPRHGAISTHIVKPDISDRLRSVLAEYVAMRLAADVGLSTADVMLRKVGGRFVLFVRRFDRLVEPGGDLRREHHETCAQALVTPPERKYEVRGGPGIVELAALIRRASTNVARDLRRLTTLIVYNALVGNADAHVGNFGLMHYANGATRLAPAYDLLPYESVLGKPPKGFAMQLGGSFEFGNLTRERMLGMGSELGVAPRGVVQIWEQLRAALPSAAVALAEELRTRHDLDEDDERLLDRIIVDVSSRC